MRIGVDIDDVLVDTSELIKEYIAKFDTSGNMTEHIEEIMRGEISEKILPKIIDWKIINAIKKVKLKPNAKEVLERLGKTNEIIFITARGDEKVEGVEKSTINFLKKNDIKYDLIIFKAHDKAKICKENNIDLLIDDSIKFCEEAEKEGIRAIVFNSSVNKERKTNIERVDSWEELEKIII